MILALIVSFFNFFLESLFYNLITILIKTVLLLRKEISKPPTNPLRLSRKINVRVPSLTESSGTRIWTTLIVRIHHYFCLTYQI